MRRIQDIRNMIVVVRSAVVTVRNILAEHAIDSEEIDDALKDISNFLDWIGEYDHV